MYFIYSNAHQPFNLTVSDMSEATIILKNVFKKREILAAIILGSSHKSVIFRVAAGSAFPALVAAAVAASVLTTFSLLRDKGTITM